MFVHSFLVALLATVPSLTSASFIPHKGLVGRDIACVAKAVAPSGTTCNVKGYRPISDDDSYMAVFFISDQITELSCAKTCSQTNGCNSFYWGRDRFNTFCTISGATTKQVGFTAADISYYRGSDMSCYSCGLEAVTTTSSSLGPGTNSTTSSSTSSPSTSSLPTTASSLSITTSSTTPASTSSSTTSLSTTTTSSSVANSSTSSSSITTPYPQTSTPTSTFTTLSTSTSTPPTNICAGNLPPKQTQTARNGKIYATCPGNDFYGGDIPAQSQSGYTPLFSRDACIEACAVTSGCIAAAYIPGSCWLKNVRGPATFRDGEDAFYLVTPTTSLSQVLTSAPSPKPAKTVRCEKVTAGHLCPNKEIYYGSNAKSICNIPRDEAVLKCINAEVQS